MRGPAFPIAALLATLLATLLAACLAPFAAREPTLPPAPSVVSVTPAPGAAVLVGAGDIATCRSDADEATARLLDAIGGTVFTTGDNVYDHGTPAEFLACYEPTWGRHRDRTLPVPGNHDYDTAGAAGYLAYFGDAARPHGTTWYAADVGSWRVIVLDSNCPQVEGGCDEGGPQMDWLRGELARPPAHCTVAIWHHPRFSSGPHGDDVRTAGFWRALEAAGADVILTGHDHHYERFAPQDVDGAADPSGIRQFVVGTGGTQLRAVGTPRANSEARNDRDHGVLRLTLREDGYDWAFVPVAGGGFHDSGSASCR